MNRDNLIEAMALVIAKASGWEFTGESMHDSPNPRAQEFVRTSRAVLTALSATHWIAPKEPTKAMSIAGGLAFEDAFFGESCLVFDAADASYRAMRDASPTPPEK